MHTVTLDRAIAAAPNIGFIDKPNKPAANGIQIKLQKNAQNRFSLTLRSVARLSLTALTTSVNVELDNTISAESIATSVPAPIAIPISAFVSAGASLIPSPTIATLPCFCSSEITASFPSGFTPATTRSTPATLAIALAVRSLSPVNITTCIPSCFSFVIASNESSLIVSAAVIIPISFPSCAKNSGVLPSLAY